MWKENNRLLVHVLISLKLRQNVSDERTCDNIVKWSLTHNIMLGPNYV